MDSCSVQHPSLMPLLHGYNSEEYLFNSSFRGPDPEPYEDHQLDRLICSDSVFDGATAGKASQKIIMVEITVEQSTMPYIIGQKGRRINSIKLETNCDIKNYNGTNKFTITGAAGSVQSAINKIKVSERIGLSKLERCSSDDCRRSSVGSSNSDFSNYQGKNILEQSSVSSGSTSSRFLNKIFSSDQSSKKSIKPEIQRNIVEALLSPFGNYKEDFELLNDLKSSRCGQNWSDFSQDDSSFWDKVSCYLKVLDNLKGLEYSGLHID